MIEAVSNPGLPVWVTTLLATAVGGAIPIVGSVLVARAQATREASARAHEKVVEGERWRRDIQTKEREHLRGTFAKALTAVSQLINVRTRMNTVGQRPESEEEAREYMGVLRAVLPELLVRLSAEKRTTLVPLLEVLEFDFPVLSPLQELRAFLSEVACDRDVL